MNSEELRGLLQNSLESIENGAIADENMSPRLYMAWKDDLEPFLSKSAEQESNKGDRFKVTIDGFFLLCHKALE